MGTALKHFLIDYFEPAYKVAMKMGISEVRLSKISSGIIKPKPDEKNLLANILGKEREELFPEDEVNTDDTTY